MVNGKKEKQNIDKNMERVVPKLQEIALCLSMNDRDHERNQRRAQRYYNACLKNWQNKYDFEKVRKRYNVRLIEDIESIPTCDFWNYWVCYECGKCLKPKKVYSHSKKHKEQ